MVNFSSSASRSLNAQFLATSGACLLPSRHGNSGLLPAQSPRSHHGHGLLHRADPHFSILYCFFVIEHDRRKILHFNVTEHPTGPWIVAATERSLSGILS